MAVTENAQSGGHAAALRGLAEAAGKPLTEVLEMAREGQLGQLFRGGQRYRWRMESDPFEHRGRDASSPRTLDPHLAQLQLKVKRMKFIVADYERASGPSA